MQSKLSLMRAGLVLAYLLLGACDSGPTAQSYLEQARQLESQGSLLAAALNLKNALQKAPDLAEARWLLGKIYIALGNGPSARKELERAEALGRDDAALHVALARSLILSRAYEDALTRLDKSIPGFDPALRLALRGEAELGLGRSTEARADFNESLRTNANSIEARIGHARLAWIENDLPRSKDWLAKTVSLDPEALTAWLMKGELELVIPDYEAAETTFRRATALRKDMALAHFGLARALLAQRKTDEAQAVIEKLKNLGLNPALGNYLDGVVAYQRDDMIGAKAALASVFKEAPKHPGSLFLMGLVSFRDDQPDQAMDYLTAYLQVAPRDIAARRLIAGLQLRNGRQDLAVKNLETIEATQKDDAELMTQLGLAYIANGQQKKGREALARASKIAGSSSDLHTRIAMGFIATGLQQKGIEQLETAADKEETPGPADVFLVYSYLQHGDVDGAWSAAQTLARKQPKNPVSFNMLGVVSEVRGDIDGARKYYKEALALDPSFIRATLHLARLDKQSGDRQAARQQLDELIEKKVPGYLRAATQLAALELEEGNQDKARTYYETILAEQPDNAEALVQLGMIVGRTDGKRGIEFLEKARDAAPRATGPRLVLAQVYLQAGKAKKALEVAKEAFVLAPGDYRVLNIVGAAQWAAGKRDNAIDTFTTVAQLRPSLPDAHLQLGSAQLQAGHVDEARKAIEKTLELSPDSVVAKILLGRVHLVSGETALAGGIAEGILADDPKNVPASMLAADALVAEGKPGNAATLYARALQTATSDRTLVIKLFRATWSAGDRAGAYKVFTAWLDEHPDDASIRGALAGAYESEGRREEAIVQYEGIIEKQPTNVVALNNLAWLYGDGGKVAQALELAKRAYEIAPQQSKIVDTYAWTLVKDGKAREALPLLKKNVYREKGNPTYRYHLAVALAHTGDLSEAQRELESLLASAAAFPEKPEAERLLNDIK